MARAMGVTSQLPSDEGHCNRVVHVIKKCSHDVTLAVPTHSEGHQMVQHALAEAVICGRREVMNDRPSVRLPVLGRLIGNAQEGIE